MMSKKNWKDMFHPKVWKFFLKVNHGIFPLHFHVCFGCSEMKTCDNNHDYTWKINIEPQNDGLEDDFYFPGIHSQVPCSASGV